MIESFSNNTWNEAIPATLRSNAIEKLESGYILLFPQLAFSLSEKEKKFLSPEFADPRAKNISYDTKQNKLWGVCNLNDNEHVELKQMLARYSQSTLMFINELLPHYAKAIQVARTSFRPVEISGRITSYRKDDKRLHVDAFPSAPNQGKRILRVFTNINPHGQDRVWRIGEPFEKVATQFLPRSKKPLLGKARLLRMLKITKSYRTLYDHYMLQIHDAMKKDEHYQQHADQQELRFAPGNSWIVQTDHVSHAAMQGQYVLEQTFSLPVHAMQNHEHSPLHILEKLLNRPLL